MFQEKLGNLFEKKERVKALLEQFSKTMGGFSDLEKAQRVADLCKADLVTDMVREFPELQGIVARLYAHADGEEAVVSQALEEHYLPIMLSGSLPSTDVAALVALADKLDTLAGDFAVGLIPSGSADPYGLRRAAVGVIRILENRKWPLSLGKLLMQAVEAQPKAVCKDTADTWEKLNSFMKQRLSALFQERGYKFDEIDAVLDVGLGEIVDMLERVKALHEMRSRKEFETLSIAFKRGKNIVVQAIKTTGAHMDGKIQPDLLKEPCEQVLFQAMETVGSRVVKHVGSREYSQALESLVGLREPLDGFFNGVMVMAEDSAIRANRLELMRHLVKMFSEFADFSKLQNA
jgi:glycyl-tRNA synthetase beta chain